MGKGTKMSQSWCVRGGLARRKDDGIRFLSMENGWTEGDKIDRRQEPKHRIPDSRTLNLAVFEANRNTTGSRGRKKQEEGTEERKSR